MGKKETNFNAEIAGALQPLLKRVRFNFYLSKLPGILTGGLVGCTTVFLLARLFPWENSRIIAGGVFLLCALLVGAFMVKQRPGVWEAARVGDDLGLQERLTTALVINEGVFFEKIRDDALSSLKSINLEQELLLKVPRKGWFPGGMILVALLLTLFLPNPMDDVVAQRKQEKAEIKKQAATIEKLVQDIKKQETQLSDTGKEILAALEDLKKQLDKAKEGKEAISALSQAEEKLEESFKKEEEKQQTLSQVAQTMANLGLTSPVAEKIKSGDTKGFQEEMGKLAEAIKNLTLQERQALAQTLSTAATKAPGTVMQNSLSNASQNLTAGQLTEAMKNITQASQQMVQMMPGNTPQTLAQALATSQGARMQIAQASGSSSQVAQGGT